MTDVEHDNHIFDAYAAANDLASWLRCTGHPHAAHVAHIIAGHLRPIIDEKINGVAREMPVNNGIATPEAAYN